MSDGNADIQIGRRLAGKWQIPALALSLVVAGVATLRYRDPLEKIPFEEILGRLPELIESGQYTQAVDAADVLLRVPDKSDEARAPVYAALARARMLNAMAQGARSERIARAVLEQFERAFEHGAARLAEDDRLEGTAHEWLGQFEEAARLYERYVASRASGAGETLKRLIELKTDRLGVPPAGVLSLLTRLIDESAAHPDRLRWAVDRAVVYLCAAGQSERAQRLVDETSAHVEGTSVGPWWAYFRAEVLARRGDGAEAERRLRALRDSGGLTGSLFARAGWRIGQLVMEDDDGPARPEEGAVFFREAIGSAGDPAVGAAAELDLASAMVMLERFDEAVEHVRVARRRIERVGANHLIQPSAVLSTLAATSELLKSQNRLADALSFAELAVSFSEGVSDQRRSELLARAAELESAVAAVYRRIADRLTDGLEPSESERMSGRFNGRPADEPARRAEATRLRSLARKLMLDSGAHYEQVARLNTLDEQRAADASWLGAQRVYESGDHRAAIEALSAFMNAHPLSEFNARALRMIGQSRQALGETERAIETYQRNLSEYPRTPDAMASLIPLARCYLALGPEYADQAEKTLRLILEDSSLFTPAAPEFGDALFLLGDLLNRTGSYERAVPVLEEALARYPRDKRAARARFLLGDCYLQSGLALEQNIAQAGFEAQRRQLSDQRTQRLEKAAEHFEQMVTELEHRDPATLSELDRLYLRHGRAYLADCRFELHRYDKALASYEQVAWIYNDTTTALAAYVQIINCHLYAGRMSEAAAALRRARFLVESLPEEAFHDGLDIESRDDWRRYFNWVDSTTLF